ncbi:non-ribosomal peptide synthetase, partial [Pseudomonas yamanorum]
MNAEDSLKLARRFIGLPLEKRQMFLQALQREGVEFSRFPIPAGVEAEDRQALSYAQQRMWFLWHLDPHSGAYNLPAAVRLTGRLNISALEQAFVSLIERHETLRTVFQMQADDTLLQVPAQQGLTLEHVDLSALPAGERESEVVLEVEQQSLRPFDLAQGPLLRVRLLKLADTEHVLLLTLHHIVSDGWSMNVLIDEFCRFYDAHDGATPLEMAPLPIQYSDYALWQRRWLEAGEQQRQLDYWLAQLGDEHPVMELPADRARPSIPTYNGRRHELTLDSGLADQLRQVARQHGVTLFMLLLGSFAVLLQRYTGQNDLRIGVPIANRNRNEIEGLIGFFVNTQVLRLPFDGQTSVRELLAIVKEAALGAQSHQDLPFERLVEALKLERSLSYNPLFQVMYNHQPEVADVTRLTLKSGLQLGVIEWESRSTQFDLSLDTFEKAGQLHASFTYATDLFEAASIQRLAQHWHSVLRRIVDDPAQRVGEVQLLGVDERQRLMSEWGRHDTLYPSQLPVHQLFEQQAAQAPDAVALIFEGQVLSYGELNTRANRLAHHLVARGVGPEVLVGIAVERGLDMVVGLLAVLKAGGGYVPLDPQYPVDRLLCMIEDSACVLVLTQSSLQERLPIPPAVQRVCLDQDHVWREADGNNPVGTVDGENLAYVMFTSGSTGRPKGVGITHASLTRHAFVSLQFFGLSACDRVLQFSTFNFDGFVEQLYPALICGASVVLRGNEIWDSETLYRQLIEQRISVMDLTTAYWNMLAKEFAAVGPRDYGVLRQVHSGGEAMPPEGLLAWRQAGLCAVRLLNTYGPTEATVTATTLDCTDYVLGAQPIPLTLPIGNVLPGRSLYVLDDNGLPAPIGVVGELVIGGELLARGYFGRPSLSAERFMPDPFSGSGARLYRTGDLARFNTEGVLEYVGRIDHQVKIRGFRIELGEIEARLLELPTVRDAIVLAVPGPSGLQLAGYVVPADKAQEQGSLREAIRAQLAEHLPDYMVPGHVVFLDALPLSPNGKLDRKALPLPDAGQVQQTYVAPATPLEQAIAGIWQDVLKLGKVGLHDNFFELGGDSIISIQVVSRARQAGIGLSSRDVFIHQTVKALAGVARLDGEAFTVDQGPVTGVLALSPIQQLFFETPVPVRHHWNQAVLLRALEPLQADALSRALCALMVHHDNLRSRFTHGVDGWSAEIADPATVPDDVLWQATVGDNAQLQTLWLDAQRSLDLQRSLVRAVLATLADGSQRLLLVIHHLVVDGVSWRILLEDLQQGYRQALAEQPVNLAAKTSSFKAWSKHLQGYARREDVQRELAYWQAQLHGASRPLPCENPHGSLQCRHAHMVRSRLSPQLTRQLLQDAPGAYRTQVNDLLLTALAQVAGAWTGQADTLIQLEGHGREELFDDIDLSRSVGWFTSLFPLRLTTAASLAASIKQIKEQVRAVPLKGIGFGVLRYQGDVATRRILKGLEQPRITFNYLGQFDGSFDAGQGALFVPAGEGAGAEQDADAPLDNWLSIEGQVYDGELELRWTFSREMFATSTVQRLADDYRTALQQLIEHCCDAQAAGLTPSDVALSGLQQERLDTLENPANIEDIYPLSPMQQGMLFHSLYEQANGTYINQLCVDIDGLDVERFRAAWQACVDAHDILRSSFLWQGELAKPLQVIHRRLALTFTCEDWQGRGDLALALANFVEADRAAGFELERPGLLRLTLIKTGPRRHYLVFTNHHILMDGWSSSQLLGEVFLRYGGHAPAQPAGRFRSYIEWLQRQDGAADEVFWKEHLAHLQEPTLLASALTGGDRSRDTSGYGLFHQALPAEQTRQLEGFARQRKVTVNTLVQAAWLLLLQRYTGRDAVAFGSTVAGRPADLAGIEQQLGLFINTLPVVGNPKPEQTVDQWLQAVQAHSLALREHEHTALFDVQRWSGHSGAALFDTLLVFENYPVSQALEHGAPSGLAFGAVANHDQTNYPLTLGVTLGQTLALHYSFDRQHFSAPFIEALDGHLRCLLEQMCAQPARTLGELNLLNDAQRQILVQDWNATATVYPLERAVHQLIEDQVARTPQAIALQFGEQQLTYRELDQRANQLAHQLISLGVGPEVLVGLAMERSLEMVIGLLAVLKAGGAYVPLDPDYPTERLAYMIEDSAIGLLLSQRRLLAQLPIPAGLATLCLDEPGAEAFPTTCPGISLAPENLAYVIYTSGSTGKPKGAGNRHKALTNRLCWMQQAYRLTADDAVLQKTPFSFDVSVWEFFWPLMSGARLVVAAPGDHREPTKLVQLITARQITTLHFVPSMLQVFLQDAQVSQCTSLTRIV